MFSIVEIGKRGWWNTSVVVRADEEIMQEEKRLRNSGRIVRVETWRIGIGQGETFRIHLPSSVGAKLGDKLSLEAIKNDRALRSKWKKIQSF